MHPTNSTMLQRTLADDDVESLLARLDCVISFLLQFFHRDVHLLASKVVDLEPLHYAVRMVGLDLHWKAVDQSSLDAV